MCLSFLLNNRLRTICLMTTAAHRATGIRTKIRLHIDGGANFSVTNNPDLLLHFKNIKPYSINGVTKDEIALTCTGIVYLPWWAPQSTTLLVRCYYSHMAAKMIKVYILDPALQSRYWYRTY
jgi:hypothetical protein